jgi:myo-inositol-1-phosphate synthase
MKKIRVALVGIGNCASSFVQGIARDRSLEPGETMPGVMHRVLGGYRIGDIVFSAAFDVSKEKVGKDLAAAVFRFPNNTARFANVPRTGCLVRRGPTMDGIGPSLSRLIVESPRPPVDVAAVLKQSRTEVVVNFLPVGSEAATRWYAGQALKAGCAFVNCIPVFIARDRAWRKRFEAAGLPLLGDDVKSQVGATILHRTLVNLFQDRGLPVDRTYQLNTGGNADFLNMCDRERVISKKISKTGAVVSQIEARGRTPDPADIHIGPSDFVPWQKDNKICFLRIESREFGGVPMSLECRLSVEDSPNSAGVVVDAVRCARLALDRGLTGTLDGPSAYFMKSPPRQTTDERARLLTERFIRGK